MRQFLQKYGAGVVLTTLGLIVILTGTGAGLAYQHFATEPADGGEARAASTTNGGLMGRLHVEADALGLHAERSLEVDPNLAHALPLPGVELERDLETPLDSSTVRVAAGLDLATGEKARRAGAATTEGDTVTLLAPAATPAAAIALASLTAAGLLAYGWTTLKTWGTKLLVLPAMGLYAKITRAEVFENGVRERIFGAIKASPGIAASDLSRIAGVSWGTTIYHLDVLEQTRMVTSLREGRYRRYFENGAALPTDKKVVAILQNPVTSGVVSLVRATPGATQKELALATGMSPQALHWHLARLVKAGVVRKEREGRVVRHFASA